MGGSASQPCGSSVLLSVQHGGIGLVGDVLRGWPRRQWPQTQEPLGLQMPACPGLRAVRQKGWGPCSFLSVLQDLRCGKLPAGLLEAGDSLPPGCVGGLRSHQESQCLHCRPGRCFWIGIDKLRLCPGLRTWHRYGTGDMAPGGESGRGLAPTPLTPVRPPYLMLASHQTWNNGSDNRACRRRPTTLFHGPCPSCAFPVPVSPSLPPAPGFLPVSLWPSLCISASPCLLSPVSVFPS